MNWILASAIMYCSSVIYYLFVKKAAQEKINYRISNIANFSIPALLFLSINLIGHVNLFPSFTILFYIFLGSLFLSYIGSVASYKAIAIAPNAGYSLIIQKSYAVYTSIVAIFLFDATFSLFKFAAILLTLASTAYISITPGLKVNRANYTWVFLSFVSFFAFGTLRLSNKLIYNLGVPSTVLLFWTMTFVTSFSLIDFLINRRRVDLTVQKTSIITLIGIGVSVTFFYYFLQTAEFAAPNIGFVNAINSSSNAAFTVLVAWLFKDKLTKAKMFAVITATVGLILLII